MCSRRFRIIFALTLLALFLLICLRPRSALSLVKELETIDQCAVVIDYGTTSHNADADLSQLLDSFNSTSVYWAGRYRTITFPTNGVPIYRLYLAAEDGTVTTLVVTPQALYTDKSRYRVYGETNPIYKWLCETAVPRR